MGFLSSLFGGESAPTNLPALVPGGHFEVVGESFYSAQFARVARKLGAREGEERFITAELRLDPTNPHSKSGKAVAVYLLGGKVGHIPESECAEVYDAIIAKGMKASCEARVYFDSPLSPKPRHSVSLDLRRPVSSEGEALQSVAFAKMDDSKKDELNEKREARIRGEGPPPPELKAGDIVCPENLRGFELRILEKQLAKHDIEVVKSTSAVLHVVDEPSTWNHRVGLERLLKKDIPSLFISEFFSIYPQLAPTGRMAEAVGQAREWLDKNPDPSAVEKEIVQKAARQGSLVLKGHAVAEGLPVDGGISHFALYDGRVMKDHRENLKNLLTERGAEVYDKLLVVGDLRRDPEKSRIYISVGGKDICAMYVEQREYFDIITEAKKQDLVEIFWEEEDLVSVKVFSFYFHY